MDKKLLLNTIWKKNILENIKIAIDRFKTVVGVPP